MHPVILLFSSDEANLDIDTDTAKNGTSDHDGRSPIVAHGQPNFAGLARLGAVVLPGEMSYGVPDR